MNSIPCNVCGEEGHHMRRCPTLCDPLKSGFYAPPAGARQGGDEEDEKVLIQLQVFIKSSVKNSAYFIKNNTKPK